jgi:hypothetical protein
VQLAVYQYEGSINKFLMDDKGSTLLAVFGLPPLSHEDDATRGVLAGLSICSRLWDLGLSASVGITTGVVFCGVVGSATRKEYTVLGDTVNLSARLMQNAFANGGGIVCDQQIRQSASQGLEFHDLGTVEVKGKTELIKIFRPVPPEIEFPTTTATPGSEPNLPRLAYDKQVNNLAGYRLLRPYHVRPPPAKDKTAFTLVDGAAAGAGGPAQPTPAEMRRASRVITPLTPAAAAVVTTPYTLENMEKPPSYPASRMSALVMRRVDATSQTTLPTITSLKVFVADQQSLPDALTRPTDYMNQVELPETVPLEGSSLATLADLRDAVVEAAKAAGRVFPGTPASEFQLKLGSGLSALVPASSLPVRWLAVFVSEIDHKFTGGGLDVELVKVRDQWLFESRQQRARNRLLNAKMNLLALGTGGVMVIEGDFGMGKTELLNSFVMHILPGKCSVLSASCNPFSRSKPYSAWCDLITQYIVKCQVRHGWQQCAPSPPLPCLRWFVSVELSREGPWPHRMCEFSRGGGGAILTFCGAILRCGVCCAAGSPSLALRTPPPPWR